MDKEKIRELLEKGADLQVPVEFQLALLGLNEETIKNLQGKTGLDIACGNGSLVEDLIDKGILFEGIDLQAPEKPYFIRQNITNVSPLIGSIPRDDDSYDIVTAFQCWDLNRGFTMPGVFRTAVETEGEGANDDRYTARYQHAQSTVYEATRVAKPGCKVVAYPALTRLEETIGPLLRMQGISFHTEPIDKKVVEAYLKSETPDGMELPDKYYEFAGVLERTILVKK